MHLKKYTLSKFFARVFLLLIIFSTSSPYLSYLNIVSAEIEPVSISIETDIAPTISNYTIERAGGWNNGQILNQLAHFESTNTYPVIGNVVKLGADFQDENNNLLTARLGVHPTWFRQESSWGGIAEGLYDFSWDSTSVATYNYNTGNTDTLDGVRRVLFQAQDGVNPTIINEILQEYSVIVDNTAPIVDYGSLTPINGSTVNGTITLDGDFSDNFGLYDVRLGVSGVSWVCYFGPSSAYTNDTPANGYRSCEIDTTTLTNGTYQLAIQGLDKAGNTTNIFTREIIVNNVDAPIVNIVDEYANIVNGYACGLGNVYEDDGLKVEVQNWVDGYKIMGRYFISGGSYSSWFNLQSWGVLTVNGSNASIFLSNTGNSTSGAAGWEVKVVDSLNNDIGNTDSLNYIITTDLDSLACNGIINLGFETKENFPQTGVGQCIVQTNDKSENNGQSALQILRWEQVDYATKYLMSAYSFNGASFDLVYPDYEIPFSDLDFITEPGIVIYKGWATNEGIYAYEVKAFDSFNNLLGNTQLISPEGTEGICAFIVERTAPVTTLVSPSSSAYWKNPIEISGNTSDASNEVLNVKLYYKLAGSSDDWALITTLNNNEFDPSFDWSYIWTPPTDGSYDIKASGTDSLGNVEASAYAYSVVYDTVPPFVKVTSHNDGDIVKGIIEIRGSVQDLNLLRYYFVIQNGTGTTVAGPGVVTTDLTFTDMLLLNWDTTSVPNGNYVIKLEARDKANNKIPDPTTFDPNDPNDSVDWVQITVDNEYPVLILPSDTTVEAQSSVGNIFDYVASATDNLDGSLTPVCAPISGSLFPLGTTIISCSVSDSAGNVTEESFSLTVEDTTAPATPTHIYPTNNLKRNAAGLNMQWSLENDYMNVSEPVHYFYQSSHSPNVYTNGALVSVLYLSTALTTPQINASATPNGTYYWQVKACDSINNCSNWSTPWKLIIDNTNPAIEFYYNEEQVENQHSFEFIEGDSLGGISVKGLDNDNVKSIFIEVKQGETTIATYTDSSGNGTQFEWDINALIGNFVDTSIFPEGTYKIFFTVTDEALNNSETFVINVLIENYLPLVTFSALNPTIIQGSAVKFTGSFTDRSDLSSVGGTNSEEPDDKAWSAKVDYGDSTPLIILGTFDTANNMGLSIPDHVYSTIGTFTAKLTVCEEDPEYNPNSEGVCTTKEVTITVNTIPQEDLIPAVYLYGELPSTNSEGVITVLSGQAFSITSFLAPSGNAPYDYVFSGACSGSATDLNSNIFTSNTLTLSEGTTTCAVSVTDSDGDTTTSSVLINVAAVLGVGTDGSSQNNNQNSTLETSSTNPKVAGESIIKCDKEYQISGKVYKDLNNNGIKDSGEEGVPNLKITFFLEKPIPASYPEGVDKIDVKTVTSSIFGNFSTKLCASDYKVRIEGETTGFVIGNSTKDLGLFEDVENFDFVFVSDQAADNTALYAFIILICIASTGVLGFFIFRRVKSE